MFRKCLKKKSRTRPIQTKTTQTVSQRYILTIINIPEYKTKMDLMIEFKTIIDFKIFALGEKNDRSKCLTGLIEFNTEQDMETFALEFKRIRQNVISYL